ncbi:MAG: galactosyldiacylglycerol synthase [Ardenticatenia bacterium]|nr:MAG: galactosyldiacylglycerol synthase [Ardenticatenia bacterium]
MKRVLFLIADTGGGHRAAAEALVAALEQVAEPGAVACRIVDFMKETARAPFNRAGDVYGPVVNYAPWLWGLSFYATYPRPVRWLGTTYIEKVYGAGLARIFREERPDIVVSVHGLATTAVARVLRRVAPQTPFVVVVTDLSVAHPFWFCPDATAYYVPSQDVAERARRYGVPASRITVAGQPIHPRFREPQGHQADLKRVFGLPPDRPLVLIMGGGEGTGPLRAQAEAVAQSGLPLSLMVVCGRNKRLYRRLSAREWPLPTVVCGFVRDIPTRMAAADVLITKAGPGTIAEALTAGRPLLIGEYIPGQEAGNVSWVVDGGAAFYTPKPPDIIAALHQLFDTAGRPTPCYEAMAAHARRMAQPEAALTIARGLLDLLGDTPAPTPSVVAV